MMFYAFSSFRACVVFNYTVVYCTSRVYKPVYREHFGIVLALYSTAFMYDYDTLFVKNQFISYTYTHACMLAHAI